jgi:hypothetical protein
MRYIVFCLFSFFLTAKGYAQGNRLAFNRVFLLNSTTDLAVPIGKVWKVSSAIYNICNTCSGLVNNTSNSCSEDTYLNYTVFINNGPTRLGETTAYFNPSSSMPNNFFRTALPLWLPEGATLRVACGGTKISIIEFNVIPE